MAWIYAEFNFAGLFSYRIPNLSPSYALTSPIPGPAAIRLALVDVAIRTEGKIRAGEEIFEKVKSAPLEVEPPEKVSVLKYFIKRLKPSKAKGKSFEESFGVREYCHFGGPLKIYLKLSEEEERLRRLFLRLRRLGTTDSILSCNATIQEAGPDITLTARLSHQLRIEVENFERRPVVTLNELTESAEFAQINPYEKKRNKNPFVQKTYILPLREIRKGENFVLYEKVPFSV